MKSLQSIEITTGLAIFSMLFGAGNIMLPLIVGVTTGSTSLLIGLIPFLLTAVCLPLIGLVTIILFDGNYIAFFNRLGTLPGTLCLFACMLIIGPLVAMPRIVTTSYIMLEPFIGLSLPLFSLLFIGITFLCTVRENTIISILGNLVSPILLISLALIITKGIIFHPPAIELHPITTPQLLHNLLCGYLTLDLLGSIFFASIVLTILQHHFAGQRMLPKTRALITLKGGLIGTGLLTLIYIGLGYLGAYYGPYINASNPAEMLSTITTTVFDTYGAIPITIAVLMACFSTMIALTAVVADYAQRTVSNNNLSFSNAVIITLGLTLFTSNLGLSKLMALSEPIIWAGYPLLIVITIANLLYKLFGIKTIKIPTLCTIGALLIYYLVAWFTH